MWHQLWKLCDNSHYESIMLRTFFLFYTDGRNTEILMFILGHNRLFPCPLCLTTRDIIYRNLYSLSYWQLWKLNEELSPYFTEHHAVKAYWLVKVQLSTYLSVH